MSEITTIVSIQLPMQLDSISWNKKHNVVAIGAYMIDPSNSDKRIGKIFLNKLYSNEDKILSLESIQVVDTSGVLDLRWEPQEEMKLAVATSDSLALYELVDKDQYSLNLIGHINLKAMALYAQWIDVQKIVYSDSEGVVNIVSSNPLQITTSKKVHNNLTWVVQYSSKFNLLFAGSDEGKFTGFTLDNMEDEEKHFIKKFQVGVTSIIFFGENVLAVGSYDDTLKIFTIDCTDPIHLSLKKKIEFGGAVWRSISFPVKIAGNDKSVDEEVNNFHIVAACMRDGVHILNLNCKNWSYETLTSCMDYEGFLAYGLDATFDEVNRKFTVISCYFDNQQLHLWETTVPKKCLD